MVPISLTIAILGFRYRLSWTASTQRCRKAGAKRQPKIPRQMKKWTKTTGNTCFLEIYHR